MDDLTLMRSLHAERAEPSPEARAAAWRALEARFDAAAAAAAPILTRPRPRRRGHLLRHRRLVVFAGATAAAAAVAGVLVFSSGPTAQPAAAEILRETAAVAASPDAAAADVVPGPGQFLYTRSKRLQLEGWVPVGAAGPDQPLGMVGGLMSGANAFNALMPTTQESWLAADGAGRNREVAGTPRFLSSEEKSRWEGAGSPLPAPFDPAYQRRFPLAFADALELGPGVADTEHASIKGFRLPDTSSLPTEAVALRRAVEANRIPVTGFNLMYPSAKRLDPAQTKAELINILVEGNPTTPQLRAAIFNALAELPGISVDTDAADSFGRQGYAIRSVDPKTGGGMEFIFDPDTSDVLATREFIGDTPGSPYLKGLPAGFTVRETAYLETGVVDSTRETAAEGEGSGG